MNFQRYLITALIITISVGVSNISFSQKSGHLPANVELSYNGTFQKIAGSEFRSTSENGQYKVKYDITAVSDEMRELKNLQLYEGDELLFTLTEVIGSDLYVSNSGNLALMDMKYHYKQEITIQLIDKTGELIMAQTYRYASLFGFSPGGDKFVVGTDKNLNILDLENKKNYSVNDCSKFAFSNDEHFLITAKEDNVTVYQNYKTIATFNSGYDYPRGVAISNENHFIYVIDKTRLTGFSIDQDELLFIKDLPEHCSYRDLRLSTQGQILAGVHFRHEGISTGILNIYSDQGDLMSTTEAASKNYPVFEETPNENKSASKYETISWPFVPFDQVHKVWNHYEQHMGDGSGSWSYLHQGLDIEVPIDEPTYAVEEGWVKLVLTLGGDIYWRVAVCPEQVPGYADGWLYAHLVPSSIQVDVGDYVNVHDYLGDIIYWSNDWGHIHFVEIHDQGTVWYYDDDEWGINFNPLLALDPITDDVPPVIENFSVNSKFGFCVNETSVYLNPNDLYGNVDFIVKISDYHGYSEWEQPAFKTYYWLNQLPDNNTIFQKTLGQILNHSYTYYSGGYYEPYAPLMYKKDDSHPSPPWMETERNYWQILTNNNGDSIAELSETQLSFPTANYPDGDYRLFVEAWDEFGNMVLDSMAITFDNFATGLNEKLEGNSFYSSCFPNPANESTTVSFNLPDNFKDGVQISIFDASMCELLSRNVPNLVTGFNSVSLNLDNLVSGSYFYKIKAGTETSYGRLIIL